jgi:N-acetylmuramoyl-L-alanine amidase
MIIQKPCPNFRVGRNGYKPEIITIHIMAGSLAGTDSWFASPTSQVSSHYGVGLKGEVHQYVKDEDQAWTQGYVNNPTFKLYKPGVNPNAYCLSIEHEGFDLSNGTEAQLNASAELIRTLAARHNIPIDRDHIIGHYEIDKTRKPNCPSVDKSIMDKLVARAKNTSTMTKEQTKVEIKRLLDTL